MAYVMEGTNPEALIGGVDTRADVRVAAVVNHVGGVLGVESVPTTRYRRLPSWPASHRQAGIQEESSAAGGLAVSRSVI